VLYHGTLDIHVRISDDSKDQFWAVVRRCLELFHRQSRSAAQAQVRRFRKRLDELSAAQVELLYHSEPFDVACRLTDQPLDVKQHLQRYIEIRDEIMDSTIDSTP
jgi:hypothetical protein